MQKIILSTLLGTVVYFIVGWIVFEGILGQYTAAHTTQLAGFKKSEAESSMLLLLVSCAAYALLLSVLFNVWAQINTFREGALAGCVIGLLIAAMTDTYWYATSHFYNNPGPMLADIAAAGVTVGIMGGVIGWFLGYWGK